MLSKLKKLKGAAGKLLLAGAILYPAVIPDAAFGKEPIQESCIESGWSLIGAEPAENGLHASLTFSMPSAAKQLLMALPEKYSAEVCAAEDENQIIADWTFQDRLLQIYLNEQGESILKNGGSVSVEVNFYHEEGKMTESELENLIAEQNCFLPGLYEALSGGTEDAVDTKVESESEIKVPGVLAEDLKLLENSPVMHPVSLNSASDPFPFPTFDIRIRAGEISDTLMIVELELYNVAKRDQFTFTAPENCEFLLPDRKLTGDGKTLLQYEKISPSVFTADFTEDTDSWLKTGKSLNVAFYLRKAADLNEIELLVGDRYRVYLWTQAYYEETFPSAFEYNDYRSSREKEVQPLKGNQDTKIAKLKQMFPQGKYWSHSAANAANYRPDSWSNYPCTDHNTPLNEGAYRCNWFNRQAQCNGFAGLCYYLYHGILEDGLKTETVHGSAGLKVGDVIHTNLATDGPNGHWSFVWKIVGDTVYKLEGNYAGNCKIWHSATVKKSDVIYYDTPARRTVTYYGNGGTGSMSKKISRFMDGTRLDPVGFVRNGYVFAGWSIQDAESGTFLYQNSNSEQLYFKNDDVAEWNGFDSKVLVQNCASIDKLPTDSSNIVLYAEWNKLDADSVLMHRLYNPNSGEHFYTQSGTEYLDLTKAGWNYEGTGWFAPKSEGKPVFRLYNRNAGDHHYTMDEAEKEMLVKAGWKYEGVGWYSADESGLPLWRQYNPNAKAGSHNYTLDKDENDFLVSHGWRGEGIGWYGLKTNS